VSDSDSVTTWIGLLRAGDPGAAAPLWERYFPRLVGLARARLAGTARAAADEEDVALSAFHSFCRAAAADRFDRLDGRDDLWQLLVVLTTRKAHQERRRQAAAKRGGGGRTADGADVGTVAGGPDPATAAEVADELAALLAALPHDDLRRVAVLKLEGRDAAEIAAAEGVSARTVGRKLGLIREYWESSGSGGRAAADPASTHTDAPLSTTPVPGWPTT
jgi:DNA-directed RNA polymerase specialized sigma24 family protein